MDGNRGLLWHPFFKNAKGPLLASIKTHLQEINWTLEKQIRNFNQSVRYCNDILCASGILTAWLSKMSTT